MICENCRETHDGSYGSGRFCSSKCARGFSTKVQRQEISKKASDTLKSLHANSKYTCKCGKETFGSSRCDACKDLTHVHLKPILELKTLRSVIVRLHKNGIGCSQCNWNDVHCDTHHIVPKSQGGSDEFSNLSYLCPNCHRKVHAGMLASTDSLVDLILKTINTTKK